MKITTSTLTGAQLDYHTARAQGVPAERLEIRRVQRSLDTHCIKRTAMISPIEVVAYSTDWQLAGALIEQHHIYVEYDADGYWCAATGPSNYRAEGLTPQVAICRAVVRAAFGEEVEEVAVCPG